MGEGVECSPGNSFTPAVQQNGSSSQHVLRRFSRERQQQYVIRPDAELNEICDAVNDRASLACSGPGNNKMRSVDRGHGLELSVVQFFLIINSEPLRMNKVQVIRRELLESELFHSSSESY